MKDSPFLKLGIFSVILVTVAIFSASILLQSLDLSSLGGGLRGSDGASEASARGLAVPVSNCDIRSWYNYQVVAIPKLNDYWIEQGISLEERAKMAFVLRHNARKNARYMMTNQAEVEVLRARDLEVYGNPDGPTFDYLIEKNHAAGKSDAEIYESIIASASRTNNTYNLDCN